MTTRDTKYTNAMISISRLLVFLQICCLLSLTTAQQCYWPDGSNAQSNYLPCNATAKVSMCCAVDDACTTRGWCLGSAGYVYRGGCTDNSWTSSACQQQCKFTNTGNFQNLYPCATGVFSTIWCCSGVDSRTNSCCNNNFSFPSTGTSFMPAAEALVDLGIDPTSSVKPTTSTTMIDACSTTTAIVLATATIQTSSSSGVAVGGVAGAAIGSAFVGAVIGLIAGWLIWRTSRKSSQSLPPTLSGTWTPRIWELPHSKVQPEIIQELGGGEARGEMTRGTLPRV